MYDELVKRLRDAAKMSEALAVLLPHSEGNATAKLYREAADAIEELTGFVQEAERDRDEYRERLDKANDAIEELSKYANAIRKLKCEGWYLQQTKYHDGYQAVSTMPLPEPPKEDEA